MSNIFLTAGFHDVDIDVCIGSMTHYYRFVCLNTPVGVGTDVVEQRAVLQHGLHLPQGDVLTRLQLHQVFFTIWKHNRVSYLQQHAFVHVHMGGYL